MELKKLFIAAAAATMLAGCSETDELALNQVAQQNQKGGIQFDVYTQRAITRAGAPGNAVDGQYGITTESLKNLEPHNVGFGVFAYYTSNSEYDTNSSTPNFMYNEQVKWDGTKQVWTYEPVKYWPNEFGDAANSDDLDKVSFFAYAPYVDFTVNTGVPVVKDGEKADSVQKKNIVGTVKNTTSGDPYIKYIVDTDPATSVDLLWGVAADKNGYRGLNYSGINETGNVVPGNCYLDLTKQIGTTDSIKWNFKHALAQLNIQIIAAVDTATEGNDIYVPKDATEISTNADGNVDNMTKMYLRWIEFGGFVMKGALNLHSEDVETPGVQYAEPNWKGFDGTNELVIEPVRFNDGLKDGKEGTTNNVQKNELPVALNDTIIEKAADIDMAWEDKHPGIPTAAYCNLFKNSGENAKATDPIYVIPTGEDLTIEMLYDVMTKDEKLAGLLSDNKTHGSAIENKINKETGVILEAGKSYVIKIVVGLESVKFSVEVTPWKDAEPKETDVDLPFNPGYKAEYDAATNLPKVLFLYKTTEDPADFKVATMFNKLFATPVTRADYVDSDFADYYYFGNEFEYRIAKKGFEDLINVYNAEGEYTKAEEVEKFNPETGKFEVNADAAIYFFSEKLKEAAEEAEATQYTVTATTDGNGTIQGLASEGKYNEGATVTLKAVPNDGYEFVEWQDETGEQVSTNAEYTFTAEEDVTLKAIFQAEEAAEITAGTYSIIFDGDPAVAEVTEKNANKFTITVNGESGDFNKGAKIGDSITVKIKGTNHTIDFISLVE